MAKVVPSIVLDEGTVEGAFLMAYLPSMNRDFTRVSLKRAKLGELDLRGAMITKEFFEGTRFANVLVDENTQVFNEEGEKLNVSIRVIEGHFKKGLRHVPYPKPYTKVLAFDEL